MKRPARLGLKLLLFGLYGVMLAVWHFLKLPCIPRAITGVICPGCGLSRAWFAALRLDLMAAFSYHPMFWSIPVLALFILYDGRLFRKERLNNWILGILLFGLAVCYIIRLFVFLGGNLTI